jgi:hypothetical protein
LRVPLTDPVGVEPELLRPLRLPHDVMEALVWRELLPRDRVGTVVDEGVCTELHRGDFSPAVTAIGSRLPPIGAGHVPKSVNTNGKFTARLKSIVTLP